MPLLHFFCLLICWANTFFSCGFGQLISTALSLCFLFYYDGTVFRSLSCFGDGVGFTSFPNSEYNSLAAWTATGIFLFCPLPPGMQIFIPMPFISPVLQELLSQEPSWLHSKSRTGKRLWGKVGWTVLDCMEVSVSFSHRKRPLVSEINYNWGKVVVWGHFLFGELRLGVLCILGMLIS